MEIIGGTSETLSAEVFERIARYRHRVFIETLGWELPSHAGFELDQFDRPDTIYMAAREEDGRLVGTARLLPTDRPYLLGEVFPQLMGGAEPPCRSDVWELSRFAAVDFEEACSHPLCQFSSPVTLALMGKVLRLAAANGVSRLITVSPIGVERLLRRGGFAAHRAAPPVVVNGQPLFACWIEVQGSLSS
ncbi:MAG: acyl-homoserine-lactone synthase [Acidovorax sp.]